MVAFGTISLSKKRHQHRQRTSWRQRLLWAVVFVVASLSVGELQLGILVVVVTSFSTVRNSRASTTTRATTLLTKEIGPSFNDWAIKSKSAIDSLPSEASTSADTDRNNNSIGGSQFDNNNTIQIRTRFFLVNTKHPGNVGSSARSIKTMGFFPEGLVVVNPHDKRVLGRKKCIEASSGAMDVLEQTLLVVDDDEEETDKDENESEKKIIKETPRCLEQALLRAFGKEEVLVCGTGMPVDMSHSRASKVYLEPRKFFESLLLGEYEYEYEYEYQNQTKTSCCIPRLNIAFVFGNERYGMKEEDMNLCDVVLGIPTHPSFGSLNLATAVQIVAYDWRQALGGFKLNYDEDVS